MGGDFDLKKTILTNRYGLRYLMEHPIVSSEIYLSYFELIHVMLCRMGNLILRGIANQF